MLGKAAKTLFVDKGASQVCVSTYCKCFGSGTKVIKRIQHIGRLVNAKTHKYRIGGSSFRILIIAFSLIRLRTQYLR